MTSTTFAQTHLRRTFRALELRDYRLLAFSQLVSIIGTIVHGIGLAWLVLRLDGGGVALGLTFAAQFLPVFVIGPLGGVIADRHDKRRLLLITQTGMAATAGALAALTITGHVSLVVVGVLALVQGGFGAVDGPTRGALIPELVGPERLANAVSLQEVWVNTARVAGPVIGGTLIATMGVGACFVLNALSFVPVLVAVAALPAMPGAAEPGGRREHLLGGIRYAWHQPAFRWLFVLAAAIGAFFNHGVVLPLLARDTFDAGPQAFGAMISAIGAGAIVSSLVLASSGDPSPQRLERLGLASATALALTAVAPDQRVALVTSAAAGAAGVCLVAVGSALLQLRCEPDARGRVLALWSVALIGSAAISGPVIGWIASTIGPRAAMGIIALAVAAATLLPRRTFARGLSPVVQASPDECSSSGLARCPLRSRQGGLLDCGHAQDQGQAEHS